MNKLFILRFALVFTMLSGVVSNAFAQVPTVQDCLGAIPICQGQFHEVNAYQGVGNIPDEINPTPSCLKQGEKNDVWYIFTVQSSGVLNFSITPNTMSDDYDWAVYNLTTAGCEDIYTDPSLEVSCNYSGTPGITGPNGLSGVQNMPTVNVNVGEIYVINVSQWTTSSQDGYTIDFSASTADIYDQSEPEFLSVNPVEYCDSTKITCRFTEGLVCESVHPYNFQIFPSSGTTTYTVTDVSSVACDQGAPFSRDFVISFEPKLAFGEYLVFVTTNGDDYSVLDNCGNQAREGFFIFATASGYELSIDKDDISCHDLTDGTINASLPGAVGNIRYSFEGGPYVIGNGIYTGLPEGSYNIRAKTENNCVAETVVEIVNPPQAFADAGLDGKICSLPRYMLAGTDSPVGTGTWTASAPQITFNNAHAAATQANNIPYGISTLTWTVDNGVCGMFTDEVVITRYSSFTYAGDDNGTCELTEIELYANNPAPGHGFWTTPDADLVFDNPTLYNTHVRNITPGPHTLTWTTINGPCGALSDDIVITNYAPSSDAVILNDDFTICDTQASVSANLPIYGNGFWTSPAAELTVLSPESSMTTIENLQSGDNIIVWVVDGGACESKYDTVHIYRESYPTVAILPEDESTCSGDFFLQASEPIVGQGIWTAGPDLIFEDPTSFETTVSGLEIGTSILTWTITNGVCPPSSASMNLTRDEEPTQAEIFTNDKDICSESSFLRANTPIVGTGLWIALNSGTISDPTSSETLVSNLGGGYRRFVWQISNGSCEVSSDTVRLRRFLHPSESFAGEDQILCADQAELIGNQPGVGQGTWLSVSGVSIFENSLNNITTVQNLAFGDNELVWLISNGVCPKESDTIHIYRDIPPSLPDLEDDFHICKDSEILTTDAPIVGTGVWAVIGGTAVLDNSLALSTSISNLGYGGNTIRRTISNGTCPPASDDIIIYRDIPPSTSQVHDNQTICSDTSQISADVPAVGVGSWITTGNALIDNQNTETGIVRNLDFGENAFVWEITSGVCPPESDTLYIVRDMMPTVAQLPSQVSVCSDIITLLGNSANVGAGTWVSLSSAVVESPDSEETNVTNLAFGYQKFVWKIENGTCPASRDTIVVDRSQYPSQAVVGQNDTICSSNTFLSAVSPEKGIGAWFCLGDAVVFSEHSENSETEGLEFGENVFVWEITSGVCPPETDTLYILRDMMPTVADLPQNFSVCSDTAILQGNQVFIGTGNWTSLGSAVVETPDSELTTVSSLATGSQDFVWIIENGTCPASQDTITVFRSAYPSQAVVGMNDTVCSITTYLSAVSPQIGIGTWRSLGTAVVLSENFVNTEIDSLDYGENVFVWEVANDNCPTSTDTLYVRRDREPSVPNLGADIEICGQEAQLYTIAPVFETLLWTTSGNAIIANPTEALTEVSGLDSLENQFILTYSNGVCPPKSDTLIIMVNDTYVPIPQQLILPDIYAQCDTFLTAPLADDNCAGMITAETSDSTSFNLQGVYTVNWKFYDEYGNEAEQYQTIVIEDITMPEIHCADTLSVYSDSISDYQSYRVKGEEFAPLSMSDNCSVDSYLNLFNQNQSLEGEEFPIGLTPVEWQVKDIAGNLNSCICVIEVIYPVLEVRVPQAFSPNGSGKNDVLKITGLDVHPENTLTVFNRWGNKVYEASPYLNDWDGRASDGTSTETLPDGTYFYTLELSDKSVLKGYVYIKK